MKTEIVKNYMNVDSVYETILDIYKEVRADYEEDENYGLIESEFEDEALEERAFWQAQRINEDMNKYIHMEDHRIVGNFNNIEYDYANHVRGEFVYDIPLLQDLVERLDKGLEDERTNADRDFLTEWFWDTFGTFGIRSNFQSDMSDLLYVMEQEEELMCV